VKTKLNFANNNLLINLMIPSKNHQVKVKISNRNIIMYHEKFRPKVLLITISKFYFFKINNEY
jgi:hypothetical protein